MTDTENTDRPELTQDALNELLATLKQLRDAWTIPGQHADYHEYQKEHLHKRWASLEAAIIDVLNADPTGPRARSISAASRIHKAPLPVVTPEERAAFERGRDEIVGYPAYSGGPEAPLTRDGKSIGTVEVVPASQTSSGWAELHGTITDPETLEAMHPAGSFTGGVSIINPGSELGKFGNAAASAARVALAQTARQANRGKN